MSRDQPQPGSFPHQPREAKKRDPGNEVGLILRRKLNAEDNDMLESKLKANNCNRGQLFPPYWVSSARCIK